MAMRHKEEKCVICDMSFKTREELTVHEAEKHLIMHIVPPSAECSNRPEQKEMGEESKKEPATPLRIPVGRAVNDPHCRTVTLPNGDKTIIPKKTPNARDPVDVWYEMDPGVRAAASILLQLESGAGIHTQNSNVVQDTVVGAYVNVEQSEPTCSGTDMQVVQDVPEPVTEKPETMKTEVVTDSVENVGSSLKLPTGLHKIGTTDDGLILALMVKADGTCSLVKVIPKAIETTSALENTNTQPPNAHLQEESTTSNLRIQADQSSSNSFGKNLQLEKIVRGSVDADLQIISEINLVDSNPAALNKIITPAPVLAGTGISSGSNFMSLLQPKMSPQVLVTGELSRNPSVDNPQPGNSGVNSSEISTTASTESLANDLTENTTVQCIMQVSLVRESGESLSKNILV
jgi:hypothetical protein